MATLQILGAGGSEVCTDELHVDTDDFVLIVNDRQYRIGTNDLGELQFAFINGVNCRIENNGGTFGNAYPGITIVQRYIRGHNDY